MRMIERLASMTCGIRKTLVHVSDSDWQYLWGLSAIERKQDRLLTRGRDFVGFKGANGG